MNFRNLREIGRFGHKGSGNGELDYPIDVVAGKGELYVSDYENHRIQVFTMKGCFIRSFTVEDPAIPNLYFPRGLCVGPDGLLYVACGRPDRILAFTLAGECVASLDMKGGPTGIYSSRHR